MSRVYPQLDSGVVAQYSARRVRDSKLQWSSFLGEPVRSQQLTTKTGKVWRLAYTNLTADEAYAIRGCFESWGSEQTFQFVDPWTQTTVQDCTFGLSGLRIEAGKDLRYRLELEVHHAG